MFLHGNFESFGLIDLAIPIKQDFLSQSVYDFS